MYAGRFATLSVPEVYGWGYWSLTYATIDSKDKDVYVQLMGHLAGYGATFICRDGSTCSLECKATGCKNMDYVCLPGATCSVEPSACQTGNRVKYDGHDCPNMLQSIPGERDLENDPIYQYQEWEMEQDMKLYELINRRASVDEIEEFLRFNSENVKEEIELFGDIDIIDTEESRFRFDIHVVFGICGLLLLSGSAVYLCYKRKCGKDDYEVL